MNDFAILAQYLAIAAVLQFVFGRFSLVRRLFGARKLHEKPAKNRGPRHLVDIIANSGSGVAEDKLYTRTRFRSTWGFRLVGLFLTSCLLYLLGDGIFQDLIAGKISNEVYWVLVVVACWIWYNFYVFTYEITLFNGDLICTTWLFTRQRHRLANLIDAEVDKDGYYRLRFSDGRTARILKYVQGHDTLRRALIDALDQEPEDTCQNSPKSKRFAAAFNLPWSAP